jgi:L-ascorbate metabolism protein UlaG (beta-lactamase superfamily)
MKATQFTWLGHATWKIETEGGVILLDPFLNDNPAAKVKAEEIKANFILVSHGHFDHISDAASIAKRCDSTVVANFEIAEWLAKQGVQKTIGMNIGGATTLPFGKVKLVQAIHSSMLPDGSYGGGAGGFVLDLPDGRVYFACDTALFSDMKLIGELGIDLLVCPIGDLYTMGQEDSIKAVHFISPKKVAPTHFNTWPPINQDAKAWAALVKTQTKTTPIVRGVGEAFGFGDE